MSGKYRNMNIIIVAAVALNGVIGNSRTNSMPWNLPTDLKHFKCITHGKTVVMGRRTFESIGKPLPNRRNIVITSDSKLQSNYGIVTYPSLQDAWAEEDGDIYVIGGQSVYEEAFHLMPRELIITVVKENPVGDVLFPVGGFKFLHEIFIHPTYLTAYIRKEPEWLYWVRENGVDFTFTRFVYDQNQKF